MCIIVCVYIYIYIYLYIYIWNKRGYSYGLFRPLINLSWAGLENVLPQGSKGPDNPVLGLRIVVSLG